MITESPLKMMKNAFYFILKALFVEKIFKFFAMTFWSCRKNGSIRKVRLISKSLTSRRGKQTIEVHILSNFWRSKGNQAMNFGQLIGYNMRNIFVETSWAKCAGETIPRPYLRNQNLTYLDQKCKVLNSLFLLFAFLRTIEI